MQPAFVSAAKIAATLTPALRATDGVITITGIGDHLRPEWPITITGMRSRRHERLAEEPHVTAMSLTKEADFLGQSSSHLGLPA